jgi:Zn finger protein HypA/HybF involved in hydrogenase expression
MEMPSSGDKPAKIRMECLKCGKVFQSDGRFNRICPTCKHKNNRLRSRADVPIGMKSRYKSENE